MNLRRHEKPPEFFSTGTNTNIPKHTDVTTEPSPGNKDSRTVPVSSRIVSCHRRSWIAIQFLRSFLCVDDAIYFLTFDDAACIICFRSIPTIIDGNWCRGFTDGQASIFYAYKISLADLIGKILVDFFLPKYSVNKIWINIYSVYIKPFLCEKFIHRNHASTAST